MNPPPPSPEGRQKRKDGMKYEQKSCHEKVTAFFMCVGLYACQAGAYGKEAPESLRPIGNYRLR